MKSVTKRIYLIDFSLAVLGYVLMVIFDTLNKKLIGSYYVSQIIFINSISALLPIILFTQSRNAWAKLKKVNLKIHFFRSGLMFLAMLAFITNAAHLPLVVMYSVAFTAPLMLTIGANLFLNEKVGWRRYSAIIVGFIGVLISLDPFNEPISKYVLLTFLAPLFVSISWLIVRKHGQTENVYSFLIYGKLFLLIFSGFFLFSHFITMNLNDFIINFISGIIRGIALIFIINSARHLPSSLFAPTQYIQILAGGMLGFLVFGDIPTLNNYLGNILIVAAGVYIITREIRLSKKIVSIAARPATIPTEAKE
ncbi:MAG: Permease of the drug/metabolite transporter (DMT) superfamily [Pelagibacterales bacterium]|nr:Permease of the drug/metabolite transporter (DMT) superfamily [Pelagibacterales bacterium]